MSPTLPDAAPSFALLVPTADPNRTGPVELGELAELYRFSSPDAATRPTIRANFIASVDGVIAQAGADEHGQPTPARSGSLGGPGDRAIFAAIRDAADIVLVGAATATLEEYRVRPGGPRIAILSHSGAIPPTIAATAAAGPSPLFLVPTGTEVDAPAGVLVRYLPAPSPADPWSLAAVTAILAEFGGRVVLEGGPRVLRAFLEQDLVDELCMTIAPQFAGSGLTLTGPTGVGGLGPVDLTLRQLLTDNDGFLYARYGIGNR